jgi:hypothetical protein
MQQQPWECRPSRPELFMRRGKTTAQFRSRQDLEGEGERIFKVPGSTFNSFRTLSIEH